MEVPSKPEVIQTKVYLDPPAVCGQLLELKLPHGTVAQTVIEEQKALILRYEDRMKECVRGLKSVSK